MHIDVRPGRMLAAAAVLTHDQSGHYIQPSEQASTHGSDSHQSCARHGKGCGVHHIVVTRGKAMLGRMRLAHEQQSVAALGIPSIPGVHGVQAPVTGSTAGALPFPQRQVQSTRSVSPGVKA